MRAVVAIAAACALAACKPPETAAGRCRQQVAIKRMGRSMQHDPNESLVRQLEDEECSRIGREEHAEARADAREKRAEQAAAGAAQLQDDESLARIRRAAQAPELGATIGEARVICNRQRGNFGREAAATFGGHDLLRCDVGGRLVFVCVLDAERINACDRYIEDADLVSMRQRLQADLGPPESETVSDAGFRVFSWSHGTVLLTMYEHGVRLRVRQPEEK